MDKVIIRDLVARGVIGVNEAEREVPQEILINIVAFAETRKAANSDKLTDCVDYRALAHKARTHAEAAARHTVEALANDLAELCLQDEAIQKVVVRVEKPGAVRFSASVGVEVERSRDGAAA
jgi:FolB domain-containing protein